MQPVTRALAAIICLGVLSLSVAACGASSSSDKGKNPLDNALGYVPKNSPFVASFDTNPKGRSFVNGKAIIEKFPFANQIEQGLTSGLKGQRVDYNRDLRPLLGNQFVVGATSVKSFVGNGSNNKNFVGAIQAKSGAKLKSLIKKEKSKDLGDKSGAKLYQSGSNFFAVKDDVLVVAGTRKLLEAAVARRGGDNRFSESAFDKGTGDLPKGSAVRTYFNLQELLARDPSTANALKIKWVKALRSFGLSTAIERNKIRVDFNLATDSSGLTDADLPLASGDKSPAVIDKAGEIGFGLRGLDKIYAFGENAAQAVDPNQFSSYETAKQTVEKQLNINVDKDLFAQLSGDISLSSSVDGKFSLKAKVKDEAAFKKTLAKLGKVLPAIIQSSTGQAPKYKAAKGSNGLYSLVSARQSLAYGVIDGNFVLSDTPANARQAATAPTSKVEGAAGALSMRADAAQLVNQGIRRATRSGVGGSQLGLGGALGGALFTGPLGDISGSAKADTSGVAGNFSLSFK